MKRTIVLLLMFTMSAASAQQAKPATQQKLEALIGSLIVENASLGTKVEELQAKVGAYAKADAARTHDDSTKGHEDKK